MTKIKTNAKKVGNSIGIELPLSVVKKQKIRENDPLIVVIKKDKTLEEYKNKIQYKKEIGSKEFKEVKKVMEIQDNKSSKMEKSKYKG